MPWTICEKSDVLSLHPISTDELKDEWSELAESAIRRWYGYPYYGTSQAVSDEYHSGSGTPFLRVSAPPIISVTSLYINNSLVPASSYLVKKNYVILIDGTVFSQGNMNVKISYVSGSAVDDNTRFTCATLIVAIINYRKRYGADASIKWSKSENQLGEASPQKAVGLTQHLNDIMKESLQRPFMRFG